MDILVTVALSGISYGMILFLIAAGFSLVFGVMGILNLTHGALYMLGAYLGLTVVALKVNFCWALLAGGFGAALVALALERLFLRRLHGQSNDQVLLTLGFIYIFMNLVQWIWGGDPKMGMPPSLFSAGIKIGVTLFPVYRLLLIFIGLVVAFALWWLQEKTRVGAIVRAGMDNKEMTTGLGINYNLVGSMVFFLGAFLAGLAGFLGTPVIGINTGMAMQVLLLALIVVVFGGIGSVQGALLGAILIGLIDSFGKAFFPDLAMFSLYLSMIIILLVRPSGLLGKKT